MRPRGLAVTCPSRGHRRALGPPNSLPASREQVPPPAARAEVGPGRARPAATWRAAAGRPRIGIKSLATEISDNDILEGLQV